MRTMRFALCPMLFSFDKPGANGQTPGYVENLSKYCQNGNRTQ